ERTEEDPGLDGRARLRRGMLTAHQIAGLTTLGLMATTVVLGQLNFDDHLSPSGAGSGAYATPHRIAAYSTAAAFALTGAWHGWLRFHTRNRPASMPEASTRSPRWGPRRGWRDRSRSAWWPATRSGRGRRGASSPLPTCTGSPATPR